MLIKSFNELNEISSFYISEWQNLSHHKKLDEAKQKAQEFIDICKTNLTVLSSKHDPNTLNYFLILGVLFRGFQNFNEIDNLTYTKTWVDFNEEIEKVWKELWDCKERLDFSFNFLQLEEYLQSFLINHLENLEDYFLYEFGPGLYASPEIIIKKIKCSICNDDIKKCSHKLGQLYGGKRCTMKMEFPRLKNVALVKVPEDPRCRIWPWNKNEDRKLQIPVLYAFQIDDFLNEKKNLAY